MVILKITKHSFKTRVFLFENIDISTFSLIFLVAKFTCFRGGREKKASAPKGSYEGQDGKRVYTTDVVADSIQFLEPKTAQEAHRAHQITNLVRI